MRVGNPAKEHKPERGRVEGGGQVQRGRGALLTSAHGL